MCLQTCLMSFAKKLGRKKYVHVLSAMMFYTKNFVG